MAGVLRVLIHAMRHLMQRSLSVGLLLPIWVAITQPVLADPSAEELAKQLANPIASLVSVPLQYNYDENIGRYDKGSRHTLNVQPVIPLSLNEDWNLISRTILPLVDQTDIAPGSGHQSGTGDTLQSLFFSPKAPSESGWIWGVGPAFLMPTASDDLLGSDQWGVGPTAVALRQTGPWTYGALINHIEHVTTDGGHADISSTFFQPFVVYGFLEGVTLGLNAESSYDWEGDEAALPFNLQLNKVSKVGSQLIQFGAGLRYWAESTEAGPEGWGARVNFVLLFPK